MEFLTGKDYDHLCKECQDAIDSAAELVKHYGPDTDDIEAPVMFAADHSMLCGGQECQVHALVQYIDSIQ